MRHEPQCTIRYPNACSGLGTAGKRRTELFLSARHCHAVHHVQPGITPAPPSSLACAKTARFEHAAHKLGGDRSPTAEANTFCSISSAQGVDASLSFSTVEGNMPKNWTGSHSGQLHCLLEPGRFSVLHVPMQSVCSIAVLGYSQLHSNASAHHLLHSLQFDHQKW